MWSLTMKLYYFLRLEGQLLLVVEIGFVEVNALTFLGLLPHVVHFFVLFYLFLLVFRQQMAVFLQDRLPAVGDFALIPHLVISLH